MEQKQRDKAKKISKLHMQQQLPCFDVFSCKMTPNGRKRYMDEFYTSRAFQRYQEHSNRTSNDKVMTLGS